ncbi:MAG: hypothetical protein ACKVJK_04025, partial [Methylophagaceae bacterium]
TVNIELTQRVAATTAGTSYLPNFNQALTIGANTVIMAGTENFVLNSSVDFNFSSSYDDTLTTIYSVDSNGNPTEYELRKIAQASSGEIITKSFSIGSASKFLTLSVDDQSIIGILDITDGDGNKWTEVPYLGQDTVFTEAINSGTNSNKVPYLLTAVRTPNRFVTRFTSTGKLQIQFGSGMSTSSDTAFLPNPTNV